ncbi:MAG: metallophosphoesterase family protein, partial [Puniceicoccales bacterium]|nr:metallophosphoesterase family protein [Puniceicoccales bacterium]
MSLLRLPFAAGALLALCAGTEKFAPPAPAAPPVPPTTTASAPRPVLRFNAAGEFKIVQLTDSHLKFRKGKTGGAQTLAAHAKILDAEKPDLVVYTGDNVTNRPPQPAWDALLAVPSQRKIPFAVVLGNHDDEGGWSRAKIFEYTTDRSRFPWNLSERGPANIKGEGNFLLPVLPSKTAAGSAPTAGSTAGSTAAAGKPAALLYFLDSGAYGRTAAGKQQGYDSIAPEQIRWYQERSAAFTAGNAGKPLPALMFFHIPLQEYSLMVDTKNRRNFVPQRPVIGLRTEAECPGWLNTGMFAALYRAGDVFGVFCGHDHDNDYISVLEGIALAYGRFSGHAENVYNHIGSGARVIVL